MRIHQKDCVHSNQQLHPGINSVESAMIIATPAYTASDNGNFGTCNCTISSEYSSRDIQTGNCEFKASIEECLTENCSNTLISFTNSTSRLDEDVEKLNENYKYKNAVQRQQLNTSKIAADFAPNTEGSVLKNIGKDITEPTFTSGCKLNKSRFDINRALLKKQQFADTGSLTYDSGEEECGEVFVSLTLSDDVVTTQDDDSLMEEDDIFSQTSSSCVSLNTPESPKNFPRGIVNPNYPGFQHLAHTLSEHFLEHHKSDPDDSDFSEFEVELSVESLDENVGSLQQPTLDRKTSMVCHKNNYNNNGSLANDQAQNMNYNFEATVETESSHEDKTSQGPEANIQADNSNAVSNSKLSFDDRNNIFDGQFSKNNDTNMVFDSLEAVSCDLGTYLRKYDVSADLKGDEDDHTKTHLKKSGNQYKNWATPDILIKNDRKNLLQKKEDCPDLLRNVSPKPIEKRVRLPVPDTIPIPSIQVQRHKNESSFEITPVDIVGDFGREVELEFGLMVSGYNSVLGNAKNENEALENEVELIDLKFEKMVDASLSDCKEKISLGSNSLRDGVKTCDRIVSTIFHPPATLAEDLKADVSNIHYKSAISRILVSENSITIPQKPNSIASISITNNGAKLIPTAIVKPKYQKSCHDDRQLPPIGLAYMEQQHKQPWYGIKSQRHADQSLANSNASGTNDQRSRRIQQQFNAHLERNSRKKYTGHLERDINSLSTQRKNFQQPNRSTEKTSKSFVAVVTPRKKEKVDYGISSINNAHHHIDKMHNFEKNDSSVDCNKNKSYCRTNHNNNLVDNKTGDQEPFISAKNFKQDIRVSSNFDVYNIETAMPTIDLEAIENHLKKAKEDDKKRRNDREEIRRRLAMGVEDDYFSKLVNTDRPGRKPSLQSRLQNGNNLQICFMNDASSDTESPSSDSETCPKLSKSISNSSNVSRYSSLTSSSSSSSSHPYHSRPLSVSINSNNNQRKHQTLTRPSDLSLGPPITNGDTAVSDFFTRQARLQIEARMALAQAKDMAHMQMEIERQKQRQSPITDVIRNSLNRVGVPFPPDKRRVSRQMLTDMNIAQLQVIVNELHTQIERLNEHLVQFLMERDELHMGQDSMLVDIEDLTRYLSAKEQSTVRGHPDRTLYLYNGADQPKEFNKTTDADYSRSTKQYPNNQQKEIIITSGAANGHSKLLKIANLIKK